MIKMGITGHQHRDVVRTGERVLVTGACGFIGSHLVRHLLATGASVVALDDLSVGDARALPKNERLQLVVGCVTNAGVVRAAASGCTTVFHLAGLVGMELVTREPRKTFEVSALGTEVVLEAAAPAAVVVMLSSSCVYGHRRERTCRETHQVSRDQTLEFDGGVPGYATGKWELERLAHRAIEQGRKVLAIRPFNVVGPGQSHRHGMVLPRFIRAALRSEPLVVYGDGEQERAFSYVEDFVAALVRAGARSEAWADAEYLINLGDPTSTSVLDVARQVIATTRSASRIDHVPYARQFPNHRDVRWRVPDVARAERMLGALAWTRVPSIVQAIVESEASTARSGLRDDASPRCESGT